MVQMKLFPSKPPSGSVEYLRESLGLARKSVESMNAWLRKNMALVTTLDFQEMAFQATAETGIPRQDVYRLLNLILIVGVLVEDDVKFDDAIADLKALEFTAEEIENFQVLMAGLRFPQSKLIRDVSSAVSSAIPTVQSTRFVCDLRAVFAEGTDGQPSTKLRALVPVVVMSLDLDDDSGDSRSVVVQFSETAFSRFRRELARASEQLGQLNEIGRRATPQGD